MLINLKLFTGASFFMAATFLLVETFLKAETRFIAASRFQTMELQRLSRRQLLATVISLPLLGAPLSDVFLIARIRTKMHTSKMLDCFVLFLASVNSSPGHQPTGVESAGFCLGFSI